MGDGKQLKKNLDEFWTKMEKRRKSIFMRKCIGLKVSPGMNMESSVSERSNESYSFVFLFIFVLFFAVSETGVSVFEQ